jgi:hypothetical protein
LLLSYCSQTGWKTAPTLFTKPALKTRIFALFLEYIKEEKVLQPLLYQQSKTPLQPKATWGILVVWNKAAREQIITPILVKQSPITNSNLKF